MTEQDLDSFTLIEEDIDLTASFSKSLSTTKSKKVRKMNDRSNEKENEKKQLEEAFENYRKKVFTDFQGEISKWTNLSKFNHKTTRSIRKFYF